MSTRVLLAFDLGTTRLKVAAFDEHGRLLGRETARHDEHRAVVDGLEQSWQDPEDWWSNASHLTRRLLASPALDGAEIAGIGLSGRGNGFVPVDAGGAVLAPSWSDRRHIEELAALQQWRQEGYHLSNYGAAMIAKWRCF